MITLSNFTKHENIKFLSGSLISLMGIIVIIGWHLSDPSIIALNPSFFQMQYNTALGFLIIGVGTLISLSKFHQYSEWSGVIVTILGILTLLQYIFSIDFKIDQLIITYEETPNTIHPGRMAPNTALCFVLSGLLLLFNKLNFKSRPLIVKILSAFILSLSFTAFFGYLLEIETAYGWGNLTKMAIHTSIGFLIFSTSFFIFPFSKSSEYSKKKNLNLKHNLVTWATICIFINILGYEAVESHEQKNLKLRINEKMATLIGHIEASIESKVNALSRMADRYSSTPGQKKSIWENDAKNYIKHDDSFHAIERVDKNFIVRWIEPLKGNEKALNFNLGLEKKRRLALLEAKNKKSPTITKPITLVQGGKGFLTFSPIYFENDQFGGFIVGVFTIVPFLKSVLRNVHLEDYKTEIYINEEKFFLKNSTNKQKKFDSHHSVEGAANLFGTKWKLSLTPSAELVKQSHNLTASVIFFGLLITIIMIGLVIQSSKRQIAELELKENYKELEKEKIKSDELSIATMNMMRDAKHSEAIANEAKSITQAIVESAADAIISINRHGIILSCNSIVQKVFGYTPTELIGKNVKIMMPPPYSQEHDSYLKSYLTTNIPKIIGMSRELEAKKKDGTVFPIHLSVGESETNKGKVFTGIVRDITEKKKLDFMLEKKHLELEKANLELSESNSELEKFAYVTSHDLKAPLRGINDLIEYLDEDLETDYKKVKEESEVPKHMKRINIQVNRMEGLISGILEYSRVGNSQIKTETTNTKDLIKTIISEQHFPDSIQLNLQEKMPTFDTDAIKLQQIFSNLISNAIKYHHNIENAQIDIGFQDQEHAYEFFVQDNGPGIDSKYHTKIFEMFQTLQSRDEIESTGIGLSIIKKLVKYYGGNIWIESSPGEGSTFKFTWPKNMLETKR